METAAGSLRVASAVDTFVAQGRLVFDPNLIEREILIFALGHLSVQIDQHAPIRIELLFKLPTRVLFCDLEFISLQRSNNTSLGLGVCEQGKADDDVQIVRRSRRGIQPVFQRNYCGIIPVSKEPPLLEKETVPTGQVDLVSHELQLAP